MIETAARFIELLTGSPDTTVCVRLIHDSNRKAEGLKLRGDIKQLWPEIEAKQKEGYGVFVVVNDGGNTDDEITSVRALFVDADGIGQPAQFHIEPDFVVRRDFTHWHAYWRVTDCTLEDFTGAQKYLAAKYHSDPKVVNLSRVMRLPGTLHLKDPSNPLPVVCERYNMEPPLFMGRPRIEVAPELLHTENRVQSSAGVAWDLPVNILKAEKFLTEHPPAIEGRGGNHHTYVTACWLRDFAISREKCVELMNSTGWNARCVPPWDEDELDGELGRPVFNAYEYATNEAGAYAAADPVETFAHIEAPPVSETVRNIQQVSDKSSWPLYTESELDCIPEPEWLVPSFLPKRGYMTLYGPKATFKSFVALDVALGLASGAGTLEYKPEQASRVVYVAGENQSQMAKQHLPAWRVGRNFYDPIAGLLVSTKMPQASAEADFIALVKAVKARGWNECDLVVIDTKATAMWGMKENESDHVGMLVKSVLFLQEALSTAVLVVSHANQAGTGSRGIQHDIQRSDAVAHTERPVAKGDALALHIDHMRGAVEREKPYLLEAKLIGPSRCLYPLSEREYEVLTRLPQIITLATVYNAIKKAGEDMTHDQIAASLSPEPATWPHMVKELKKAAKGELRMLFDSSIRKWTLSDVAGLNLN